MVRTRLATLTLAGGLLLTSSGCMGSGCMGTGLFDGLRNRRNGSDCCCHDANVGHEAVAVAAEGPVLVTPAPTFTGPAPTFTGPPPTQTPNGPPPRIVPIPATPMPWAGQH